MGPHTKPNSDYSDKPFHPGVNRRREAVYLAYDAEAIAPTSLEHPMPITATATALTWAAILVEMVVFLWLFGPWGLLAISIATATYTLMDKRARQWVRRRLKNNFRGSAG